MAGRECGRFCGRARAAEIVGQRRTLLILRDLLVGPRRCSDLAAGLPGIPSNVLSTRLKELERDGLVTREARSGADRAIAYTVTPRGAELQPARDALSRWGVARMHEPREGEIVTEASLISALRVAAGGGSPPAKPLAFTIIAGDIVIHAQTRDGVVEVGAGAAPGVAPDAALVIEVGPGFRDLLAGTSDPRTALAEGLVTIDGDPAVLEDFTSIFRVPYSLDA